MNKRKVFKISFDGKWIVTSHSFDYIYVQYFPSWREAVEYALANSGEFKK